MEMIEELFGSGGISHFKLYSMRLLGSKKQCEEEEDRLLDEEASDENVESDQDELGEAPDNCLAEKQPSQRKRHPIQEKVNAYLH